MAFDLFLDVEFENRELVGDRQRVGGLRVEKVGIRDRRNPPGCARDRCSSPACGSLSSASFTPVAAARLVLPTPPFPLNSKILIFRL